MDRRFEGEAEIVYLDVENDSVDPTLVAEIEERGLLYPVTVIDGVAVYDGAVSYPAILRQVSDRLTHADA